jgi:putative transposase
MRRYGIRVIMAPPRRVRTTDSRHTLPIAPNLIARDFTAAAPNQVWLADITYIPTAEAGCQQLPGAGLIHHSDRGVQYASHEYRSVLAAANITASIFAFIEGFYNRT